MSEVIVIRHGQAQSGATDPEDYDKLSDTGHAQARWLGQYFSQQGINADRVICGSHRRHHETVASMGLKASAVEDPRWDELDYFGLSHAFAAQGGPEFPISGPAFASQVPLLFDAWSEDRITGDHERFSDFSERVGAAFQAAYSPGGRAVVISSGGVISMLVARVLELSARGQAKVLLQVANTSVHRFEVLHGQDFLAEFGATPHLAHPDRAYARTHI